MTGIHTPHLSGGYTIHSRNLVGALRPYPEYKEPKPPQMGKIPKHWIKDRAKYFFREADERSKTGDGCDTR